MKKQDYRIEFVFSSTPEEIRSVLCKLIAEKMKKQSPDRAAIVIP